MPTQVIDKQEREVRHLAYHVNFDELTAAATTQAFTLETLSASDLFVVDSMVELITTFADAGSVSNIVVDVGDGTDADAWIDNIDIFGPTAGLYSGAISARSTLASSKALTATFTATDANFGDGDTSDIDSGSVVLHFWIRTGKTAS